MLILITFQYILNIKLDLLWGQITRKKSHTEKYIAYFMSQSFVSKYNFPTVDINKHIFGLADILYEWT